MKRHKRSGSCLPSGSGCLGNICGTNIDLEDIDFARQQSNLVYMDKVFSFKEDTSCPILFNLFTGGMQANRFTVELTLDSKDCDLIPCTLSPNAVFTIDNSFVVVEYFNTRPPGNINAGQVTADGFPVDSVSYSNGQYTAKTANLLPRIQHERCLNRGLPTKAFFLINNAGPWDFRARYILEGTVNTNGRNCCFRAEITNAPNSPNTSLPNSSLSSFAIPDLSLPCSIDGIAPDILFQFKANIHMVNPRLIVNCGNNRPSTFDVEEAELSRKGCCPPCDNRPINSESCTVFLETNLAVEPTVHVETIRKTLFCVDACEALKPCDGSVTAAERAQEEECIEGVTNGSDCRCGNNNVGGETDRDRDRDCCRDRDRDRDCDRDKDCDRDRDRDRGCNTNFTMPCGNRTVGGITIGTGPCFCNDGRVIREDRVGGARNCRRLLLEEICEALAGDVDCDCGDENEGLAADGTFGCGCDVRGTTDRGRDRDRNRDCDKRRNNGRDEVRSRTAFQFNGCNGCSW